MDLWNLLPALPWHYGGWLPFILAGICWGFLCLAAVALVFAPLKDKLGVLAPCLLYIVILRLVLLFWTPTTITVDPPSSPVAEWRHRSWEAEQVLEKLKSDRQVLQERLSQADDRQRRLLAAEIAELDSQIESTERECERLGAVVVGIESRERRQERREMVSGVISAEKRDEAIRGEVEVGEGE